MGSSDRSRHDGRQVLILAAASLWAVVLLALTPVARGDTAALTDSDTDQGGSPYVAGELLVAYEKGTSGTAREAVVSGSRGRTVKDLPGRVGLVSFPEVATERSEGSRERALQKKLEALRDSPRVEAADYNYIRKATFIPNDPRFGDAGQWGLRKAGFPNAWNDARGARAKIAIVDSGVDQNHPDIGKIAAQHDFVQDDAVANDGFDHGTHVAGIAAALTNNGKGVAGGCPACEILVAKVLDARGYTKDSDLILGINWSVDRGADVINLSLAGPQYSSTLKTAVDDASRKGAVVVAAAGNAYSTQLQYPAAYSSAIAVSATDKNDELAPSSSRGDWVDLAAPGTDILGPGAGGGYYTESGTSESAPFVSALAGLLASEGMGAGQIRQRMESTATDLGAAGTDPRFGHGRINAAGALP